MVSIPKYLLGLSAIALLGILTACQPPTETPTPSATPVAATSKPSVSPSATQTSPSPASTSNPKVEAKPLTLQSLAGEYKTAFGEEALQSAQKQGIKDVSGKWVIKADGKFEASLKLDQQEVKTTGTIKLDEKSDRQKVISQVETVNGQKPPQNAEPTIFTISEDGKTWQAEGQPIKLLKQ
jgi:hypothetical protein